MPQDMVRDPTPLHGTPTNELGQLMPVLAQHHPAMGGGASAISSHNWKVRQKVVFSGREIPGFFPFPVLEDSGRFNRAEEEGGNV
jgi:hypothetical protein